MSRRAHECTEERFIKDVADHTMEILLDQGVHRHLKFTNRGSSVYRFDLHTWPGFLCISGDMGCYVFQRLEDMLEFFRQSKPGPLQINPQYWSEKLQSDAKYKGCMEWSPDIFRDNVKHWFDTTFEDTDPEDVDTCAKRDRIWEEIVDSVLSHADEEHEACRATYGFESEGFHFRDFFEARLHDYTFHFIWCLYAIVHGIRMYDAALPKQRIDEEECWSVNNEEFVYDSLGELLDANDDVEDGQTVYVGKAIPTKVSQLIDADDVTEHLADRASDIAGEFAEDYPDVSAEGEKLLTEFLHGWVRRYAPPTFYTVGSVREHQVTAEDRA